MSDISPPDIHNGTISSLLNKSSVKRLLYVRMDGIGDAVLANAILDKLPRVFPNAAITVVCDTACEDLYSACPAAARVIPLDKRAQGNDPNYIAHSALLLRACRPDLVLHTTYSSTPIAHALALSTEAPAIAMNGDTANITSEKKALWEARYFALVPSEGRMLPELRRTADWLRFLEVSDADAQPLLWLGEQHLAAAEAVWRESGFAEEKTIALFAKSNMWQKDYDNFGSALRIFCEKHRFSVVALGGSDALQQSDAIIHFLRQNDIPAKNVAGALSLMQSAALIKNCRLALGVDTGLAHIANAMGVHNVVMLGGGHFGRFMPYSPVSTVVVTPLDCFGCNWRCKYETIRCVQSIRPEALAEALELKLKRPAGKQGRPRLYIQKYFEGNDKKPLPPGQYLAQYIGGMKADKMPLQVHVGTI